MTQFLALVAAVAATVAAAASLYTAVIGRRDRRMDRRRANADALYLAMLDLTSAGSRKLKAPNIIDAEIEADLRDADGRVLHHGNALPDAALRQLVERFRMAILDETINVSSRPRLERRTDRARVQTDALDALGEFRRKHG